MLRIAIQKSGRLNEESIRLIRECGIKFNNGKGKLKSSSSNFPMEILYLRDDDIPGYVEDNVVDIGIVGLNVAEEKEKDIDIILKLGFSKCRLSLAIPKDKDYEGLSFFNGKNIATSYPNIISKFLKEKGLKADLHEISGSVEIAPGIGLADAIGDIVSSGSTLLTNGLKEVETILRSEAVLICHKDLEKNKTEILNALIFRINSVQNGRNNKYILLNAPNDKISEIIRILPGMKSPTIVPLAMEGWSSLHSVINEDQFWDIIDNLKYAGAEGILVVPIEKMIV
jgi:ATP phosphoribosyltransferase